MFSLLALCLLCASVWTQSDPQHESYSKAVGSGIGTEYGTSGEGRITAVRVWELSNSYITGFQLKYDDAWGPRIGHGVGNAVEMSLFEGEAFVQISGKYNPSNFIFQLKFVTNKRRFLIAGQPTGLSFNHYPTHSDSELLQLNGHVDTNGITSLGAHWGTHNMGNSTSS